MGPFQNDDMKELYKAVLCLKSVEECGNFFEDLCTIKELQDLSQRFAVARMLDAGKARNEQRARAGSECRKEEAHPRIRDEAHGLVHVHDHPLKGGRHESCNRAEQCRLEKIAARAE